MGLKHLKSEETINQRLNIMKNEMKQENNKSISLTLIFILIFSIFVNFDFVYAQGEQVGQSEPTVCCQKTNAGLFCQDVPQEDCSPDSEFAIPTACESTAACNPGFCFDSEEGTCLDNVPSYICNENGGTWNNEQPPQCGLGCCNLGDQASFVTQIRCRQLSGFYGLETNWNNGITNEQQCILSAAVQEKGACVYEDIPGVKTCKFTTLGDCTAENMFSEGQEFPDVPPEVPESENGNETLNLSPGEVEFHTGKLCSAEELGTNCAPTRQTTCVDGKEEVYFIDTCGNTGNIYDSSKLNNDIYWADIVSKSESCGPGGNNEGSASCGNCNYLLGSYCRASDSETGRASYGENICASLNCVDDDGKERLHGESWCVHGTGEEGSIGNKFYAGAVGNRDFRLICNNGVVRAEPCADFKQEECIENSMETEVGTFAEAACRVNRWQDCTAQRNVEDCSNTDQRDCVWKDGIEYVLFGSILNGTSLDRNSLVEAKKRAEAEGITRENIPRGACVPEIPPGLNFWSGGEAAGICAQANAACPVTYEKGIGGDWECVKNCECLERATQLKRAELCTALGDCGPKVNFVGTSGRNKGYKISEEELNKED